MALLPVSAAQAAIHTQAEVNAAIEKGVVYLTGHQNADGSFGSQLPTAETGMALAAFGVQAAGNFSNLSLTYQAAVTKAITYLEANQDVTPGTYFGSWSSFGYQTYSTALALLGLSFFTSQPGVPTAIANGRTFLSGPDFQGPANTTCSSADLSPTASYCGGWNYDAGYGRSDESNTAYAMTGLQVTGGIPAAIVPDDINWQHHVQEISSNPFATRNDGGADYQPGCSYPPFCSNANDSGANLFSYADNGVAAGDPYVAASIKFDQDVLDAYELMMSNVGPGGLRMIAHLGATEDGSCTPDAVGCDWFSSVDGGFHYSLFALTQGLGSYIASNLSDPTNWYAKVVDLLLHQQAVSTNGSWPADLRDDFSTIFATGLAVASLGKVGVVAADQQITASGTPFSATEGQAFTGQTVATFTDPDTNAKASEYSATIDWGDGSTPSNGTITDNGGGNFTVSGDHTYAEEGTYTVAVTITDTDNKDNSATIHEPANIADAALSSNCAAPATSTQAFAGPTATFTDADPNGMNPPDYSATIDWGDSSSSAGTISPSTGAPSSGPYTVSGTHTYSSTGTFTITTTITDVGGSKTVATCKTLVFAFAPGGGSFVIGDRTSTGGDNTATGTHVFFWGAQWWTQNFLSGGSAPASFKGFAESASQPSCGKAWSTDPGNSTPPPNGPLADMGVIVTSKTTKSGSQISGDTVHIVVVKTDPGYQPNPGHPGTGTVEARVC